MSLWGNMVTLVCVVSGKTKLPLYSPHMNVEGKKWVSYWTTQITLYSICWWKTPTILWSVTFCPPQIWCVWAAPCHSFSPQCETWSHTVFSGTYTVLTSPTVLSIGNQYSSLWRRNQWYGRYWFVSMACVYHRIVEYSTLLSYVCTLPVMFNECSSKASDVKQGNCLMICALQIV